MKKTLNILLLILISSNLLPAQQKSYKRLEIGDTIPDLKLTYNVNGKVQHLNSRELRGKLIILDYWNIWCSSCIAMMPEMARLQREFPVELQIFLVTDNSQKQVDDQFRKISERSKGKNNVSQVPGDLASIVGDTALHQLFPHRAVPHHIWIGKDGKVKFIASAGDATSASVRAVLKGDQVKIALKKDTGSFDLKAPLYLEGGGRQLKNLRYYSMFYKEAGEWQNRMTIEQRDTTNMTYHFRCLNFTLLELCRQATMNAHRMTFFQNNRLLLEVRETSRFYWPKEFSEASAWRAENLYCYDLAVPSSREGARDSMMMEDLNRLLPYSVKIEARTVHCLALVRIKRKAAFISTKEGRLKRSGNGKGSFGLENGTMRELMTEGLSSLNSNLKTPIIDDTSYKGKINISLSTRTDLDQIRKELREYGLDLVEKQMTIDMLVIKDAE